jgi:hypothetical protein
VGLRLYDDLNERMTRAEATQIRDFVTAEVHQVIILLWSLYDISAFGQFTKKQVICYFLKHATVLHYQKSF